MSSSPLLRKENTNARSSTSLRNYNTISRPTNNLGNDCRSSKYLPISPQSGSSPYESRSNSRKNYAHHTPHLSSKSNHEKKNKDKKSTKLGTLNGVTLPTILNVLSILMFLRFGFIIGQMGILGTIFLLLISYGINLLTTLSISAIATNGTVKGGGAYYMLSRSLGVEFGGAIGVIFYIGQILNSSMNVAGLIEPILFNFAIDDGSLIKFLPIGYWWQFFYCSILLMLCIIVALIGSSAVSRAGTYLCLILILSTLSIPISALFVKPFTSEYGIDYSGLSIKTFKENLLPNFTKGAAGSQIKGIETFNDLFGIFFPATAGILAGASMSGDLKNPSKSIPKGTLNGLLITFTSYFIVILSMGASIPRSLLYKDTQVLQTINLSPFIILAGEFSTSIFSIIVGIVGAAKLLQAIARDQILPGIKIFGNGDSITDDPKEAIILTWIICQFFLFADLNQIATFITMAFLMTFIVTNLSCALLKIGSAPNFRPSFKYFSTKSALSGTIGCLIAMFVVDGISATIIFVTLILLILFIHFVSPPKTWGDVSQSLIYHQVRKYLLKLRQDNVKYWRPQILLLVDNPRTSWKLISFCNNLKKGGLYVLGHVFVINKFQDNVNELGKNKDNWIKIRDITKVKAFVQISIAPTFIWGVRNIYLGSGLGGMKPNITITGFYDLARYQGKYKLPKGLEFESLNLDFQKQVKIDINELPTDQRAKFAPKIKLTEWIEVLEDLSLLNSNIAVARGFARLDIPTNIEISNNNFKKKQYIDLYPIQMAQKLDSDKGVLTTNFDTCTLILQMGAILHTVPNWKKTHIIRVIVFVEEEKDVKEERIRVKKLLEILRMQDSEIVVISLENSDLKVYNYISKGDEEGLSNKEKERIHELLKEDEWWGEVVKIREGKKGRDILNKNATNNSLLGFDKGIHHQTFTIGGGGNFGKDKGNNKLLKNKHIGNGSRRMTISRINQLGISLGKMSFQTNKFTNKDIRNVLVDDTDGSVSDLESINSEYSVQSNVSGRPIIETSISNESVLQMKKKKKGAFTAERMPNSTVKEDAEGNEISIMFEEDGDFDGDGYGDGEIEEYYEGRDELISSGEEVEFSVAFGDMTRRCQFLVLNEMMKNLSYPTKNNINTKSNSKSTLISTRSCEKDMMTTALIFSTLPAPEVGTHLNEKECVAYAVDVSLWTTGLPATLLLNAKTVTVTSAL